MAQCLLALGPDCAGEVLHGLIDGARSRLDVAVYEVGPSYAAALKRAAERGVRVRLLLDAHRGANSTVVAMLHGCGIQCRVLGGEAHWKLLMVDGETLALGTGNLIRRDAPEPGAAGTREWWVTVRRASSLLHAAREAIEAAWHEAKAPPAAWRRGAVEVPPVGIPQPSEPPLAIEVPPAALSIAFGGAEVAALLAAHIARAMRRAWVITPYVHAGAPAVRALLGALDAAARRGVDVRILLGAPGTPPLGLPARVMDPARTTTGHAKGLVVDAAVIVASANWSGAGLGGNREAALAIAEARAAGWLAAAYDRDWEASTPL